MLTQVVMTYFVPPTTVMHLGNTRFEARIADTQSARQKGLSGTKHLAADQAMVFVFDHNSRWGIWMKDMHYAIDIIWLDESKKIVDFAMNVTPESYPNKTFHPKEDARYVVEVQNNTMEKLGIRVGEEVVFSGTSRRL